MKDLMLPTLKGIELAKIDAFTATSAKLDLLVGGSTKLDPFAQNLSGSCTRATGACACTAAVPRYETDYFKAFQRASTSLKQAQRGWLAKGLRDWNSYIANAVDWIAVEMKPYSDRGVFDLRTFLHRRQIQGIQRRALWVQRSRGGRVRAWLLNLGDDLLSRVATGLRAEPSVPKILLAILKAPPGWTTAVRFRIVLESSLPRILEQLAQVIAPNAPSPLDLPRHFLIEAGAVQTH